MIYGMVRDRKRELFNAGVTITCSECGHKNRYPNAYRLAELEGDHQCPECGHLGEMSRGRF